MYSDYFMPMEQLLALAGFIIVMVGTPGPNNMMLMAAGANFGFRRSLPHIFGIAVGCQILLLAIALGLGQLLETWPPAMLVLRVSGSLFLLYMAVQLLKPVAGDAQQSTELRPLSFWQAVLFQWVNPKAWMMIVTALATYADPARFMQSTAMIAVLFFVLGTPLISVWNAGGVALKSWLQQGQRLTGFNRAMALLLLVSLYPLLI